MLTNFSNPNYESNDPDVLNYNLPASEYYSISQRYGNNELITSNIETSNNPDINTAITDTLTNTAGKRRKKYGKVDLNTALGLPSSAEQSQMLSLENFTNSENNEFHQSELIIPQTVEVSRKFTNWDNSDSVENENNDSKDTATTKACGFLGYYASLEMSVAKNKIADSVGKSEIEKP